MATRGGIEDALDYLVNVLRAKTLCLNSALAESVIVLFKTEFIKPQGQGAAE
jgi:hypothetical protein